MNFKELTRNISEIKLQQKQLEHFNAYEITKNRGYMQINSKIIEKFNKNGISLDEYQASALELFLIEMLEYNKFHNLTAITEIDDVIEKHFIDSIFPEKHIKTKAKVIDIGCGAGFPSIPLKIMRKDLMFTAVDSVGKKTKFVEKIATTLGFKNFNVINDRIESLANDDNHREKYDAVISRAVASLSTIIEYSAPFLTDGGVILSYKGTNYQEELDASKNAMKHLNCKLVNIEKYQLAESEIDRFVLVIQKNGKIPSKYPRNQNKPRLNPL